ncbi:MAG: hypothetical protein ACI4ET_07010 [Bilifractor sp.]
MEITISKWGNSLGFRIPSVIAKELSLKPGDVAKYVVHNNNMTITFPHKQPVTLNKLFEHYHGDYHPKEVYWGEPEGNEIW